MSLARGDNHALLMDRIYRRQRYIYDFTRKYYLFGRDRLISQMALRPGARVVEVGCGTARNLVKIASAYPEVELFGLDASAEMLASARRAVEHAGIAAKVRLVHGYAEALSPALFGESKAFDAVVYSYSLSMIPDWKQALRAALGALAPDGRLHVVDFGDLKGLGRPIELILRSWLSLFHVAPRTELLTTLEVQIENHLTMLPGRYAFVLSSGVSEVEKVLGIAVAEGSQRERKSDS